MKLSQWHDWKVKPVHVGVYNVICLKIGGFQSWSYWNGNRWTPQNCCGAENAMAHIAQHEDDDCQNKQWRGIVKDKK